MSNWTFPYARASRKSDEDSVSIISPVTQLSLEQDLFSRSQSIEGRKFSSDEIPQHPRSLLETSKSAQLREPSPHEQRRTSSEPSPALNLGFSVFGDGTTSERPYQEQVAWANSTQFSNAPAAYATPQRVQTTRTFSGTKEYSSPPSRKYFRDARHMLEPWTTGIWIRFPWWGFGALFLIFILTGASAGILLASHGTSLEYWKVGHDNAQPHVYISVFEMIMNLLILFALADAVVIRLWHQLLQGTTLDSMHDTYESMQLWSAVKRIVRLRFNMVAVACILACVSFTRGPLFQRALTVVENGNENVGGMVDLAIAPYPMIEFFRSNESDPRKSGGVTSAFSNLVRGVNDESPFSYQQPESCGDFCIGVVNGFTFKATCNSTVKQIDLNTLFDTSFVLTPFSISYEQVNGSLILTSLHKNTTSCSGDVYIQTCTLTQATSNLPIVITNNTIHLRSDKPGSEIYESVSTDDSLMDTYWPLAFDKLFPSVSVNITASTDSDKLAYTKCIQPGIMKDSNGDQITLAFPPSCTTSTFNPTLFPNDPSTIYASPYEVAKDEDPLCGLAWNDPMPDMLHKMRSLAFRTTVAMAASPDSLYAPSLTGASLRSAWTQRIPITGYRTLPLYHTSPLLVALGITVSLIGIAAVVPLYYGFWEMGRKVSLNPLEIARAFGAPMMEGLDGNSTADVASVERGGLKVRYGAVDRYGEERKLRVEDSARTTVRMPWEGEIFG